MSSTQVHPSSMDQLKIMNRCGPHDILTSGVCVSTVSKSSVYESGKSKRTSLELKSEPIMRKAGSSALTNDSSTQISRPGRSSKKRKCKEEICPKIVLPGPSEIIQSELLLSSTSEQAKPETFKVDSDKSESAKSKSDKFEAGKPEFVKYESSKPKPDTFESKSDDISDPSEPALSVARSDRIVPGPSDSNIIVPEANTAVSNDSFESDKIVKSGNTAKSSGTPVQSECAVKSSDTLVEPSCIANSGSVVKSSDTPVESSCIAKSTGQSKSSPIQTKDLSPGSRKRKQPEEDGRKNNIQFGFVEHVSADIGHRSKKRCFEQPRHIDLVTNVESVAKTRSSEKEENEQKENKIDLRNGAGSSSLGGNLSKEQDAHCKEPRDVAEQQIELKEVGLCYQPKANLQSKDQEYNQPQSPDSTVGVCKPIEDRKIDVNADAKSAGYVEKLDQNQSELCPTKQVYVTNHSDSNLDEPKSTPVQVKASANQLILAPKPFESSYCLDPRLTGSVESVSYIGTMESAYNIAQSQCFNQPLDTTVLKLAEPGHTMQPKSNFVQLKSDIEPSKIIVSGAWQSESCQNLSKSLIPFEPVSRSQELVLLSDVSDSSIFEESKSALDDGIVGDGKAFGSSNPQYGSIARETRTQTYQSDSQILGHYRDTLQIIEDGSRAVALSDSASMKQFSVLVVDLCNSSKMNQSEFDELKMSDPDSDEILHNYWNTLQTIEHEACQIVALNSSSAEIDGFSVFVSDMCKSARILNSEISKAGDAREEARVVNRESGPEVRVANQESVANLRSESNSNELSDFEMSDVEEKSVLEDALQSGPRCEIKEPESFRENIVTASQVLERYESSLQTIEDGSRQVADSNPSPSEIKGFSEFVIDMCKETKKLHTDFDKTFPKNVSEILGQYRTVLQIIEETASQVSALGKEAIGGFSAFVSEMYRSIKSPKVAVKEKVPRVSKSYSSRYGSYDDTSRQSVVRNQVVSGNKTFMDDQLFSGSHSFNGNQKFLGDQSFSGNVTFNGNQKFIGDATFSGNATFNGNVEFVGDATFDGNTTFNGNVKFIGDSSFSGRVSFIGNVKFIGDSSFSGSQSFIGNSSFIGDHSFSGTQSFIGNKSYKSIRYGDYERDYDSYY
eukprot:501167_1